MRPEEAFCSELAADLWGAVKCSCSRAKESRERRRGRCQVLPGQLGLTWWCERGERGRKEEGQMDRERNRGDDHDRFSAAAQSANISHVTELSGNVSRVQRPSDTRGAEKCIFNRVLVSV